jgi:hypothetical protein
VMTSTPRVHRRFCSSADGFHRIRHYGCTRWARRQARLCRRRWQPQAPPPAVPITERYSAHRPFARPLSCCGGRMVEIGVIPRASAFATAAPWNTS